MTTVYDVAVDEVFALLKAAWDAQTAAIVGYIPEMRYEGVEYSSKPDGTKFWARASMQSVVEGQATLSDCIGEPGKKHYEAAGLVFVQIFCPKPVAQATEWGRRLAMVARNAFRGKHTSPGNIWFFNVRINPLPAEVLYYRFNVVAEYEYDELG